LIFIPGSVPSSKNSKVKCAKGVFNSPAVRKYLQFIGVKKYGKDYVENYKTRPNLFDTPELRAELQGEYPLIVGFHFVRKTKGRFDFHNLCQIICDLLVAHQMIPDDDIDHLIPVPMVIEGRLWTKDKDAPGVYLKLLADYKLPDSAWFEVEK
jgi:hypothetical protein